MAFTTLPPTTVTSPTTGALPQRSPEQRAEAFSNAQQQAIAQAQASGNDSLAQQLAQLQPGKGAWQALKGLEEQSQLGAGSASSSGIQNNLTQPPSPPGVGGSMDMMG